MGQAKPLVRALVADDNRDAVLMLETLLRDEGFDVDAAYNGNDVIERARRDRYDAMILDIKMPGLSGYDIARTIRTRFDAGHPLLVAISGHYKLGADRVLAQLAGFDHFLAKPCDPAKVLELLAPLRQSPPDS